MWVDQRYRIRVSGVLPADWSDWLGGYSLTTAHSESMIEGLFPNQAALVGVLNCLNALNLDVLAVEHLPAQADDTP